MSNEKIIPTSVNGVSTSDEKRLPKSPGGESSDLFGAEFIGSPCHHRVLKPPGGGTSDIFGGSEPVPAEKSIARKHSAHTSSIVLDDHSGASAKPVPVENGTSKQGTCNERLFGPTLERKLNGFSSAPKTNGEVITNGTDHTDAVAPAKPSQPVSNGHAPAAAAAPRARVPPGGFSSGLW